MLWYPLVHSESIALRPVLGVCLAPDNQRRYPVSFVGIQIFELNGMFWFWWALGETHNRYTVLVLEHRRIDAFELWCWRRVLRIPWTARKSNQSILKEINPGCSLVELILKLKLQYFGHLMRRVDSLEKTLMLGKIEGRRRRGRQRMRWLDGITDSHSIGS